MKVLLTLLLASAITTPSYAQSNSWIREAAAWGLAAVNHDSIGSEISEGERTRVLEAVDQLTNNFYPDRSVDRLVLYNGSQIRVEIDYVNEAFELRIASNQQIDLDGIMNGYGRRLGYGDFGNSSNPFVKATNQRSTQVRRGIREQVVSRTVSSISKEALAEAIFFLVDLANDYR